MSDIFLSYASEDRRFAERLAKALGEKGWLVWWDRDIPAGQDFQQVIQDEIGQARCVLVLWSGASVKSRWVRDEANAAIGRLIPVCLEKKLVQPLGFRQLQARELDGWTGDLSDAAFRKLCDDIDSIIMPPFVRAYLTALWNQTRHIEIKNLRTSDASANAFAIDELYTPLSTVLPHEERRGRKTEDHLARLSDSRVDLRDALKQPRLVLVGEPGAGKSTFLRRIVFEACHRLLGKDRERQVEPMLGEPCPFPILLRAEALAEHVAARREKGERRGPLADAAAPDWLLDYLGAVHSALGANYFRGRLQAGCLLLVDGLDEIRGKGSRDEMTDLLRRLAAEPDFEPTRIVATSRPGVYGGVTSITGFTSVKIAPLDDEGIAKFAERWGRAVRSQDAEAARELTDVLVREISAKPEIRRMAENPVMLTALACLHFAQTTLPEQRSELYDSVLEWLAKARRPKTGLDHNLLLGRLRKLAYAMHTGKRNKRSEMEHYEAIGLLQGDFRNEPEESARRRAAENFLHEEEVNSGIIVNDRAKLRFWHPTFQEYLSAVHLAYDTAERQKRLFQHQKIHDPDWRETVLLLAGCLKKQGDEPVDELLRKILTRRKQDGLRESVLAAGLIGALLKDLAAWQYTFSPNLVEPYQAVLRSAFSIFEKDTARRLPFEARLEAAEALGRAGDPRLAEDRDNWLPVEGGTFWMGAQKSDPKGRNYDPEESGNEGPVRQVTVAPFFMARYPVTVAEFERFVKSGGYKKKGLWSAGGVGNFPDPERWAEQLRYPNRPVTGVSWYEATAYCASIGARLSSEEQWECAARCGPEGVRYPWGPEEPDEHRANYFFDGSPQAPTPVGMYPEGATPSGIQDLAGKVWEWTSSSYERDKYPTVRGGGWDFGPVDLRVSIRYGSQPEYRDDVLGFRCVRE